MVDRDGRLYVAGHRGLAGSAIWRVAENAGFADLVRARSSEEDLRDCAATFAYLDEIRPAAVVLAAARVGGIVANDTYPAEFLGEPADPGQRHEAAHAAGVDRLSFLGFSCIYPDFAEQPIRKLVGCAGQLVQDTTAPTTDRPSSSTYPVSAPRLKTPYLLARRHQKYLRLVRRASDRNTVELHLTAQGRRLDPWLRLARPVFLRFLEDRPTSISPFRHRSPFNLG